MLTVTIPGHEFWNEKTEEFIYTNEQTLQLEHSLASLSKWEETWNKPFLSSNITSEETFDYVRCMTINSNVSSLIYHTIPDDVIDQITSYINLPMTATKIKDINPHRKTGELVTAELIYYWMISLGIPFECQYWHLNKLLTLIRVCSIKNTPSKKMSRNAILSQNAALNASRRKALHTKG